MPRGIYKRPSPEEVFWSKVKKTDTCWLWTGYVEPRGYGQHWDGNRTELAHRFAYMSVVGPIPLGLTLDHLCRVRHCVNPEHLEVVTRGENVLRGYGPGAINARKKTCYKGHQFDKLTIEGYRYCSECNRQWQNRRNRLRRLKKAREQWA